MPKAITMSGKITDSHCLSILVWTFMKSWWVLKINAVDRSKILASRKSSSSWPSSLENQKEKVYFKWIAVYFPGYCLGIPSQGLNLRRFL